MTSALERGEWSASLPGRFTPKEMAPSTHWVGPRAVLDAVVKRKIPSPRRESKCCVDNVVQMPLTMFIITNTTETRKLFDSYYLPYGA